MAAGSGENQQECYVTKSKAREKFYKTIVRPLIMYGSECLMELELIQKKV